ncbi:hypothetical protein ZHAS_00015919 [Anopheles sinensis]|uniref:Uncharacterized protein n=1 Tax=Anopheles sinensis TaxID=74873 RepID=A0A084WCC2_ANOSI|nr:hypothetical protein ZHAS_00015919 [Anopheles sinensis]
MREAEQERQWKQLQQQRAREQQSQQHLLLPEQRMQDPTMQLQVTTDVGPGMSPMASPSPNSRGPFVSPVNKSRMPPSVGGSMGMNAPSSPVSGSFQHPMGMPARGLPGPMQQQRQLPGPVGQGNRMPLSPFSPQSQQPQSPHDVMPESPVSQHSGMDPFVRPPSEGLGSDGYAVHHSPQTPRSMGHQSPVAAANRSPAYSGPQMGPNVVPGGMRMNTMDASGYAGAPGTPRPQFSSGTSRPTVYARPGDLFGPMQGSPFTSPRSDGFAQSPQEGNRQLRDLLQRQQLPAPNPPSGSQMGNVPGGTASGVEIPDSVSAELEKLEQEDNTGMGEVEGVGDLLGELGDDDADLLNSLTAEMGEDFNILEYADPELDTTDGEKSNLLDSLELDDENKESDAKSKQKLQSDTAGDGMVEQQNKPTSAANVGRPSAGNETLMSNMGNTVVTAQNTMQPGQFMPVQGQQMMQQAQQQTTMQPQHQQQFAQQQLIGSGPVQQQQMQQLPGGAQMKAIRPNMLGQSQMHQMHPQIPQQQMQQGVLIGSNPMGLGPRMITKDGTVGGVNMKAGLMNQQQHRMQQLKQMGAGFVQNIIPGQPQQTRIVQQMQGNRMIQTVTNMPGQGQPSQQPQQQQLGVVGGGIQNQTQMAMQHQQLQNVQPQAQGQATQQQQQGGVPVAVGQPPPPPYPEPPPPYPGNQSNPLGTAPIQVSLAL